MKTDMAGCSAVIGTIKCVADLNINTHIVAYLMVTDNLINENAYIPGEIIFYKNGKLLKLQTLMLKDAWYLQMG